MVLIKNMTITSKGYWYLKAQHYTILIKVVDEATQTCFLQVLNKLSSAQSTFKEINSFTFFCIIQIVFQIYT